MLVAWYPLNGNLKDISGNHYDLNTNYLYGDVNQDGKIDQADSDLVLSYFNGNATLTDNQRALADVNQDGNINSRDSKEILNYINGINTDTLVGKLSNVQRFEPVWGEGKTGRYSLEFTGNEDMLYIENFLKSKEISISFWFYPLRKQDTTQWIVRIGDSTMSNLPLGIYINNLLRTESFGKTFAQEVELNKWIHITITASGSLTSTYINGKLVSTFSYNNSFNYTGDLTIGGRFSSNITKGQIYPLKGRLNNLKIYDHCLSKEEAYQDYLSPMLHYTFENPYIEETENIKHTLYSAGSDAAGKYSNATFGNNSTIGLRGTVYGGNYYTWSLEVNPDKDMNENNFRIFPGNIYNGLNTYFDPNLLRLDGSKYNYGNFANTGTQHNDESNDRCIVIDAYKGNIPKNTWTRVWLTVFIPQEFGESTLQHYFRVCPTENQDSLKVYCRNSMLEKKDHMTPYTRDRRERQLIRDVSGQGNDGKVYYKREEIPIVGNSEGKVFTKSNFKGVTNEYLSIGYMNHNPRYHYVGSTLCYEFDITLNNIVTTGTTYFHNGGYTEKTDGTLYWSPGKGGGPVQYTDYTSRLNNLKNGTYHITIEKTITDIQSVNSAKLHRFDLVFGNITGTVTVSNLHAYYQSLDTSTLGITNRNCAVGTHSAHFNGKNYIDCGVVTPDEMDEITLSCWAYADDWTKIDLDDQDPKPALISKINAGGFGFKLEKNSVNFVVYYKDKGYGPDSSITPDKLEPGWHLFTGVSNKNEKFLYIDGKEYRHNIHNFNKSIFTLDITVNKRINLLIGAEIQNSNLDIYKPQNVENVYIDDVRLYPVALTSEGVKALYRTKAKIDKDSNMYTNQLVETKDENLIDINNIDWVGWYHMTSAPIVSHKDNILNITVNGSGDGASANGFYLRNQDYGGEPSVGKKYRYSFYVRFSRGGKWMISEEHLGGPTMNFIEGKWYYIEQQLTAKSRPNGSFCFYLFDQILQLGDTLELRDFKFYRIDDDLLPIERDTDPKITKKAQVKGFELNEIDYDRLTKRQNIIEKDGAKWVEVFYHNTNNNTVWFADEAEALHCTSQYKYSRLDCLEQYRQSDGKFEFLLEYPVEHPGEFNRWKQTDNPTKVLENNVSETAIDTNGFESIHLDFDTNFGGLIKHKDLGYPTVYRTFLDGVTNSYNWYYSIGCYDNNSSNSDPGWIWIHKMPGPYFGNSGLSAVTEVRLYARISDEQIKLGPTIINKYGAQWLEVFYHNNHSGTVLFTDKEEAMHTIGNKDKYSILDCLEQYRGKDNKFELLLEYPTDIPGKYNRWKQQDNPAEVREDTSLGQYYAKGYEPIHIDWTDQFWGGLLLCQGSTLINGSIGHPHWHYAIGSLTTWNANIDNRPAIPGPNSTNPIYNDIHLYVRIDNINNKQQIFKLLKTGIIKTKEIKEI